MIRIKKYAFEDSGIELKDPSLSYRKFFSELYDSTKIKEENRSQLKVDLKLIVTSSIFRIKNEIEAFVSKLNDRIFSTQKLPFVVEEQNEKNVSSATLENKEKKQIKISKELTANLTKKLSFFEQEKSFLEHHITLVNTAKLLQTNSTYLSKVINSTKHKNFSNYINDLRIEYTLEQLKSNQKYRRYSIAALAEEVGFNNTKSFSRAFIKNTGKQASIFIKELES